MPHLTPASWFRCWQGAFWAVLPRWVRLPTLPPVVLASADAAWTFGLLILAMIFVAAGTYSPFLYFRF